jgi:hypothetical protein
MFSKNAAFYKEKDQTGHFIAIAVNKTSIQLQVFTEDQSRAINATRVLKIRTKMETIIGDLTKTFHKQVEYEIGYSCKDIKITDETNDNFVGENELLRMDRETFEQKCPKHVLANEKHNIKSNELLQFWNPSLDTVPCSEDQFVLEEYLYCRHCKKLITLH